MSHESPMMKAQEGDSIVIVQFKWEGVQNTKATEENGRPIFDDVLKVYISTPGSKNQTATHEVERRFWTPDGEKPRIRENQQIKQRFREQLRAWQDNNAEELAGTPLRELGISAAQVEECKAAGIHTVETLAGLSDTNLFMGARKLRDLANAYMEKAEGNAPLTRLTAENDELKKRIEELEAKLEAKPKPGRAKKAA